MPETITTTVYRLDELADGPKEIARTWYRQSAPFDDWHDGVYDDFERVCEILGVELARRSVRLYGGGTRQEACIWFSGFWNQGDGACFAGHYRYAQGAARKIRDHAPQDPELHRIVDALAAVQRPNFYELEAEIRHDGRTYHEHTMAITVESANSVGKEVSPEAEEALIEALRDLARWLYRQLEREYEYQTSDDVVDEAILANDYTFTLAGERFP